MATVFINDLGEAGLEPASREAQDPKSCVSANFTTRPSSLCFGAARPFYSLPTNQRKPVLTFFHSSSGFKVSAHA